MEMSKKMCDFEGLSVKGDVVVSYMVHQMYCADLEPSTVKCFSLLHNLTMPFWHIPPWEEGFAHSTPYDFNFLRRVFKPMPRILAVCILFLFVFS